MNREMKLLARKLTALFLSLIMVICMTPANIQAEATNEFSFEILECVDTYYKGFNDNVAVATGTFIELVCDGEANYIQVDRTLTKEDSEGYTEEITINNNEMATAQVVYEDGNVNIKVIYNETEIYNQVLYTPKYVDISQMPTISLGQEVIVANGTEKYCEQYYRVDETSVSALTEYKVFTLAVEDEDDYSDTHIFLYDENGKELAENDETEGEEDDIDSSLTFKMPETGARIVGVRGYDYEPLTTATLKLVGGATKVVSFESDNAEELNVFYEGFNDDLLYATGTRIQATLDNGVVSTWQSEGCYWDDEDEDLDGVNFQFGDVITTLYRGNDGAVYADYSLSYDSALTTKKLFTPVIKPISDIPVITEGTTTVNTLQWSGANSFYRITAEEDEVWNLNFACAGDSLDYSELYIDVYQADGTYLFYGEQEYSDETDELEDLSMEITVEAGSTIILGLYDWEDFSQEYTLTATKQGDEVPTTPEPTTPVPTTPEPTTPEPTTPSVVNPTTVAPTTTVTPTTTIPITTAKKKVTPPKKTKVKSASKKKAAKKVKISIKKIKEASGYRVQFGTTKKFKKVLVTKNVKKATITISSKKLKNKKKLYVRVKAYKLDGKKKVLAKKWSKAKRVKIKK